MQREIGVSLPDALRFVRRSAPWAIVVACVLAAGAYVLAERREPVYETRTTLLVAQSSDDDRMFAGSVLTPMPIDVGAYQAVTLSDPILESVLDDVAGASRAPTSVRELRAMVRLRADETRLSALLHVDVSGPTPELVVRVADALADAVLAWDVSRAQAAAERAVASLQAQVAAIDEQIRTTRPLDDDARSRLDATLALRADRQAQLSYANAISTTATGLLNVIQPASLPVRPSSPSSRFYAVVAFALGLVGTFGVAIMYDLSSTRFRTVDDLQRAIDLPILAEFPRVRSSQPRLPREAANYLRASVLLATEDVDDRVLLVTSPRRGQGATSVAVALAESFARSGSRALLVDADTTNPGVARAYGLDLASDQELRAFVQPSDEPVDPVGVHVDADHELDIVPSVGMLSTTTDLSSAKLGAAVRRWVDRYDIVILDSGSMISSADPLIVAPHCSGAIVVTTLRVAEQGATAKALEVLRRNDVPAFGLVATRLARRRASRFDDPRASRSTSRRAEGGKDASSVAPEAEEGVATR